MVRVQFPGAVQGSDPAEVLLEVMAELEHVSQIVGPRKAQPTVDVKGNGIVPDRFSKGL